jgi:cysteine synthase A
MSARSRYYILAAFLLGIAITTAYNKKRSIEGTNAASQEQLSAQQQKWLSQLAKINEGIEGCIGDTPLVKIKSLSDFTGCDILAKAEVQQFT